MLVSFIIPAYNAADTIGRCLESICNLTLKKEDYEIIVIDDASTDDTVSIISNFKLQVSNLILLKQPENHRQGAARNRGVKEAKGEYICFVDADDAVIEGIVKAIRSAADSKTDLLAFHVAHADEHGKIIREKEHLRFEQEEVFSGIDLQNRHPYWFSGPVAYIYSREFLERVNYPFAEDVLYEDSDFVAVHLYYAKRMMYSRELGYLAYEREGSTTHSMTYKNLADYLLLGERMLRFYETIVESGKWKAEGVEKFSEGILEGACYNVDRSCRMLPKLSNLHEVHAYYDRIDEYVCRKEICKNMSLCTYFWNRWTSLCLGHRWIATIALSVMIPIYKIVKR